MVEKKIDFLLINAYFLNTFAYLKLFATFIIQFPFIK